MINENDKTKKVINYIKDNPNSTYQTIANNNNISLSYARKIIDRLKKVGIVKRIGANKNGLWEVV